MSTLRPAAKPGHPVPCTMCGYQFKQDPPFDMSCPVCEAKAGQYCKRPSGHQGPFVAFHAKRDLAALAAGSYDHRDPSGKPCGKQSTDVKHE